MYFQIDQQFLGCEDFIQGDVRVDNERHILLATPLQKELLKTAKNWYLDGTVKIIHQLFEQLFSIHGFIQKENCMKQVLVVEPWTKTLHTRSDREFIAASGNCLSCHIYHQATFEEPLTTCDSSPTHHLLLQLFQYVEDTWINSDVWGSASGLCFDWQLGHITMLKVHIYSVNRFYLIL